MFPMTDKPGGLKMESVRQINRMLRKRLEADPADLAARRILVWGLLLEALGGIQTRQNSAEMNVAAGADGPAACPTPQDCLQAETPEALLQDCIQQTVVLSRLSRNPEDHRDVARIHQLMALDEEADVAHAMDAASDRILADMARCALPVEQRRLHRLGIIKENPA